MKIQVKNTRQYLKNKYENEIKLLKKENERLTNELQKLTNELQRLTDKFIIEEINYKKLEKQLEDKEQYIYEITKSLISNNINLSKPNQNLSNSNNINTNSYTINIYSQHELLLNKLIDKN